MPIGIYVCAKIEHAALIRNLRDVHGLPIISNWIDSDIDPDDKPALQRLWDITIRRDLTRTTHLVVYLPTPAQLKGGFIEIGAVWMKRKTQIHLVSPLNESVLRTYLGTFPLSERVKIWPHTNLKSVLDILVVPEPRLYFLQRPKPSRPA